MLGLLLAGMLAGAVAAPGACSTDPRAVAAPRQIEVPERGGLRLGVINYPDRAPLKDHEIALTFDDGPDDDHTLAVLDILDRHCIKAAFFLVGQEVDAAPAIVRRIAEKGHTLGAHSYTHPERMGDLPLAAGETEIDRSFLAIRTALAQEPASERERLARFFRFPELQDSAPLLEALKARGVTVISADYGFDDWTDLSSDELLKRALAYTEERKRGVLVLHDYNPNMIAMLDTLLTTLEERGYRFVQLVPARSRTREAGEGTPVKAPGMP